MHGERSTAIPLLRGKRSSSSLYHSVLGLSGFCLAIVQSAHPQNRQGMCWDKVGGIGLLVGFVVIWLMTIWSYVTVVSKGPGLVKDYVPESDPPLVPASQGGNWNGAPAQYGDYQQNMTEPVPIPGQTHPHLDNGTAMRASDPASSSGSSSSYRSIPSLSFLQRDLERFGGYRASSDSMRVLPGSDRA